MPDWDPEDIKAAIRKTGVSLAEVARRANLAPNALGLTLTVPRKEGERVIAAALGIEPSVIWPSRYHANGTRRSPQPRANYHVEARFGSSVNPPVKRASRNEAIAS